jgi:HTH-type transcriptional regulator / antitoxin HipB
MLSVQTPYDLGLLLRTARQQLGLTQAKLALAAGVGVRFVVDLEAGKPTVRLASVMQVVAALGGQLHIQGLPILAGNSA